jgi:hypothetical protein
MHMGWIADFSGHEIVKCYFLCNLDSQVSCFEEYIV